MKHITIFADIPSDDILTSIKLERKQEGSRLLIDLDDCMACFGGRGCRRDRADYRSASRAGAYKFKVPIDQKKEGKHQKCLLCWRSVNGGLKTAVVNVLRGRNEWGGTAAFRQKL